jgi:signal transduction histidine kinase
VKSVSSTELHLAAQLHDGVGQVLSAALMRLEPLLRQGGSGAATARVVSSLIEEAIAQTRSLTRDLCPPVLYHGELLEALQWLADGMFRSRMLHVELCQTSAIPTLQPDVRAVLFSAIRELLVNVSKHAGVKSASVTLGAADNRVFAIVRDRGVGFDPARARHDDSGAGFGLFHVGHRVEEVGGSFTVRSSDRGGSEACVTLPTADFDLVSD